ncbi:MAG: hypothetical protein HY746_09150 [Elusimicrobia bacterium]|nr:hypothetical protein [Elusimicrobiota bacterium]
MKYVLTIAFLLNCGFVFAGDFSAIDLKQINLSEIKGVELPGVPLTIEKSDKVKQVKGKYMHVWMSVRQNPSWKEAEANDYSNRIETRVRKIFNNRFDVTMNVDMHYEWSSIDKVFEKDFQMFSTGINLRMNEWGNNYNISGNVTDANNQYKYINLTMYKRFDDFSYSINGFGIYLNIDKYNINGNFDEKEYGKKAIAAIVSMALALQIEKTQTEPAPGK